MKPLAQFMAAKAVPCQNATFVWNLIALSIYI